jgi:ribosomal protein S8
MFSDLKILSKPSLIKYVSLKDLKKNPKKKTVVFLSTTKGILTDSQCKLRSIGGKLLFSL